MKNTLRPAILIVAVIAGIIVQQQFFADRNSAPALQPDYADEISDDRMDFT